MNTGFVYAGRSGEEGRWNGPETGEEGVVAEVYLIPVAECGCLRSPAGERGERGRVVEVGRTLAREGSCGRGLSWLVGERGSVERFAKGSVPKRPS